MGDDLAGPVVDLQREHLCRGRIDQPEANAIATPDRGAGEQRLGEVAQPAGLREVVPPAEAFVQPPGVIQAPVIKHDGNVAVDGRRGRLLDD